MKLIKCACLVKRVEDKLLLVRVRDNQHWYLPGGKIENGERAEETLEREILEELNIRLQPDSIQFLYSVVGPAYGEEGLVELVCFSASWTDAIAPQAEVSEVAWIHYQDTDLLAPAVVELVKKWDTWQDAREEM